MGFRKIQNQLRFYYIQMLDFDPQNFFYIFELTLILYLSFEKLFNININHFIFISMQDLKKGDIILIKGFKDPANVNFYCHMHFKDLIGLPTRVSVAFNSFYVSHPNLDSVPLNECVEFDILESTDEISHQEFKSKQKLYQQMMGGQTKPVKNLDKLKNFFLKKNINESDVESLTPKQKKLINLVDKLENGELSLDDLNNLIGGTELLIKKMNEEGIISYINPFDDIWDDYRNSLLYSFHMNDPSFIWKVVDHYLTDDVTKVGDEYYYDSPYWPDEFASLFKMGRNDISESTISEILSGDYDMDMWGWCDLLAIKEDEVLAVQTTSYTNISARVKKIADSDTIGIVRKANIKVNVHGWHKVGSRWECKVVDIS